MQLPPNVKLSDICSTKESRRTPSPITHKEKKMKAILDVNSNPILANSEDTPNHIPKLVSPYKIAAVKWQQNHSTIFLTIDAPDVCDYFLEVTNRILDFRYVFL